ncbi:MAG: hypothetical protein LBG10_01150, partial [Treponema sp.]|nr:hypothetical protein [Treponema sp.]
GVIISVTGSIPFPENPMGQAAEIVLEITAKIQDPPPPGNTFIIDGIISHTFKKSTRQDPKYIFQASFLLINV